MDRRPLAALLALLAAAHATAATVRVEVVPELGSLGVTPTAGLGAVPLQLSPNSLVSSLPLAAPAPALAPSALVPTIALAPLPVALAQPVPAEAKAEGRPLVIKTLSAPGISKLGEADSSAAVEKDFNARAQLDAPSSLSDGSVSAASNDSKPVTKAHLTLVHSAKIPLVAPATRPLDLVATPESLRGLAERGESRLLIQTPEGRWLLAPRSGEGAYPTAEEIEAASGQKGRFFVVSKAGLAEWNPNAAPGAAAALRGSVAKFAAKVPLLRSVVYGRAGVAARLTSWDRVVASGLGAGAPPLDERLVIEETIPGLVAEEFPLVAAKLGRKVDPAYAADVLKRTNGYQLYWHSASTYKDHPDNVGIPDGHFRSDFGIRLMVKPDWRKLKDLSSNFRPLFAHEYVHWLQNEGFISTKYGAEIAAVAVEVLRGIELIGLDAVKAGGAGTLHPGVMGSFEGGRQWARTGFKGDGSPYLKGSLAGAAYEAAQVTGRPGASWEFLNLVIAGKGALEPQDAWAKVVGAK